ncbi:uncharacterized protein LOC116422248 [Sarcophilus harrisii]|uniref:uncharacterized protein LOC116422248 n=1 Tax=Sarcophilus harrisii TaxID=9305 RepID=UPI001301E6FB|nr:uncharacterized protein LOC116422248 [Sarcophilus harrisii]XP_031814259.1 uncharacterized protein LOC116422248 [Sarcophilus harrisii]
MSQAFSLLCHLPCAEDAHACLRPLPPPRSPSAPPSRPGRGGATPGPRAPGSPLRERPAAATRPPGVRGGRRPGPSGLQRLAAAAGGRSARLRAGERLPLPPAGLSRGTDPSPQNNKRV